MLAWAGHIGDGHQRLSSGSHHPTWPENWAKSHTGGSPGGKRYGQVAGNCKPHLLCLTLLHARTFAKPSYLYKMLASTSPSLTSGPERSASSTRALLIRLQGPQAHSCYWLWRRLDRLSVSPPEGKVG